MEGKKKKKAKPREYKVLAKTQNRQLEKIGNNIAFNLQDNQVQSS